MTKEEKDRENYMTLRELVIRYNAKRRANIQERKLLDKEYEWLKKKLWLQKPMR